MTAAPILARTLKYRLTVSNGGIPGQSFVFDKSVVTIGRGPENDVVFANDARMSRAHVEIRLHLGQIIVRNISQKNTLYVNGEKVEEKTLSESASIQVGETVLKLELEAEPVAPLVVAKAGGSVVPRPTPSTAPPPSTARPIQNFSSPAGPPPPPPQRSQSLSGPSVGGNSRVRFYLILAVILGLGLWLFSSDDAAKKKETPLRSEGDVVRAIEESAQAVQEIRKKQEASGQDSLQYKSAQEHYIKGFRDYRQGQYARAMQSFQAALSFYPSHELARKYLLQSQRKFEALIDSNMAQGRKYLQKQNYRMCQSSFASVMIMVKDATKPKYREAKQLYDECSLYLEGRY
jgi:pSer/pThr/pTyr-binding forkhead associated (FHA) protein